MQQELLLTQFAQATNLPLHIFHRQNLLYKANPEILDYNLPLYLVSSLPHTLPALWVSHTPEHLLMGGLYLKENGHLLFVGPLLSNPCSLHQARQILQRLGRSSEDAGTLQQNMNALSLCNMYRLKKILLFFHHLLNGQLDSNIEVIDFRWKRIFPAPDEITVGIVEDSPSVMEQDIMSMVRHGKVEELTNYFNEKVFLKGTKEDISTSNLQTRRNYIIGANMLLSRITVSKGVSLSLANSISEHYITLLENAKALTDLNYIFYDLALHYTKLIHDLLEFHSDSTIARQVNSYVQAHVYEKLSSAKIAEALHFSQSYLCVEFKKVCNITLTEFIQQSKIREAKYLLDKRSMTPSEVSDLLSFSSLSYFGAVFKQMTGYTPKEYQEDDLYLKL